MPPLHVAVTTDDVTSETSVWGIWPTKGLDLFRMQKVGKKLNSDSFSWGLVSSWCTSVSSLWHRHRWMIHTIYWTYLYALCFTSRRQSQDTRYDECYCLEHVEWLHERGGAADSCLSSETIEISSEESLWRRRPTSWPLGFRQQQQSQ